jgi:hypothetical protein
MCTDSHLLRERFGASGPKEGAVGDVRGQELAVISRRMKDRRRRNPDKHDASERRK